MYVLKSIYSNRIVKNSYTKQINYLKINSDIIAKITKISMLIFRLSPQ